MRSLKICMAAIAFVAISTTANAAASFTSIPFDAYLPAMPPPGPGEAMITDFNSTDILGTPLVAAGYTIMSLGIGLYIPPLVSGIAAPVPGNPTQYMAVLQGGQMSLKTPILRSLSVLLGSLDTYNQLTFKDSSGNVVASYNGYQLHPPANGDQFAESTNREFYFTFAPTDKVSEVDFNSYGNSFEFDNIAASAVPEPAIWLMLIAGFGLAGAMLRRRGSLQPVSV